MTEAATTPLTANQESPHVADRRLRVLIVDDHADTADMLAMLVRSWGYLARTARNGVEALHEFETFRPVVALLDLGLPGQSGYDVALKLRQQAQRRRIFLVVVTGMAPLTDAKASKEAGISHHLLKPVNPESLKRILTTYEFAEEVIARPSHPGEVPKGAS